MKKDFLNIAKACLSSLMIVGILLPQLTGATDGSLFSWLSIFNKDKAIKAESEPVELPSHQAFTLNEIALLQPSAPLAIKYPQYAPYCAYKPGVSYCLTTVTAYSSTYDQTDSSPFITANGTRVSDGIIACNFLPFGTEVRIPEVYGNKVFTVEDRMARKNNHKIDIWFPSREEAKQFGVKSLKVEILN